MGKGEKKYNRVRGANIRVMGMGVKKEWREVHDSPLHFNPF
jgi:hypothetical protein